MQYPWVIVVIVVTVVGGGGDADDAGSVILLMIHQCGSLFLFTSHDDDENNHQLTNLYVAIYMRSLDGKLTTWRRHFCCGLEDITDPKDIK